jgi:hypothetical protein
MLKPKIAISKIQDVLRIVEEAPDCDETEVAKVEAMRRLVPALKTMQAKGYGLAHIAKLLCDKGIAVTEASLKQYIHRLGSRKATESSRAGRRDRLPHPSHTDAAVRTPPRSGAAATQVAAPRSGFVVRPDRKNI